MAYVNRVGLCSWRHYPKLAGLRRLSARPRGPARSVNCNRRRGSVLLMSKSAKAAIRGLCEIVSVVGFIPTARISAQQKAKSARGTAAKNSTHARAGSTVKSEARLLANLSEQRITESSGIARGDATKGILWTH